MGLRLTILTAMAAMTCLSAPLASVRGEELKSRSREAGPSTRQIREAADRGLVFLQNDATKWRAEHKCATCHHGTMTVWALSEAQNQGYLVESKTLAEIATWAKERLKDIDKPRDMHPAEPGRNMLSTPALYLAVMARALPKQQAISPDELRRIADHLVRYQETDGAWKWSLAPPANRRPPFFESDEVATLLAETALEGYAGSDEKLQIAIRESQPKGIAWLAKATPTDTTQAAAVRLLGRALSGESSPALEAEVAGLLSRQNADGGWPQARDLASDGYATGQVLYALSLAGVKRDRAEVGRGLAFLIATQRPDGSWPMRSGVQPGAGSAKNLQPITYFGSAWATLALMRAAPK